MNTEFEELIVKLHECLLSPQSGDVARSIISDIIYMCGENLNNQSTSLCISLFFKREKNLLTFLKKAIREDSLKACKVDLLQFLARFLSSTGKQAVECTPDIKDTCILIFNSDKYSDVRCSTFPVISKCLEIANGNHDVVAKMNLDKLVNDYFVSLLSQSKITSSLKANVLSMLGFMCRHHPEVMITYSNKCLNLFLTNLKTEMSKKEKHDFNVIAGSLEGLNYYLYNFTHSAEEGSEHSKNIFEFTKQALMSTVTDLTRYAVPKAALDLLAKHAEQFDEFIYADYKDLFERISQWAQHKNYEMKKLGYLALDSYYKQLAEILKKKAKSEKEKEKCREVFIYFMKKFYRSLTADSDLKETVVAIKGFGAFAGPCREFVDKREVRTMFTLIIDICERTYFSQAQQQQQQEQDVMPGYHPTEIFDEKIYQLPSFIESLACVCGQLEEPFPEGSVTTLERIVCLSIDSYNKLAKRYNYMLSLAIVRLFLAFQMGRFSFYSEFVSRVVYQSMVRTFSYRTKYSLQQEQGLAEPTFGAAAFQEEFGTDASQQREADTRIRNFMNTTSTDFVQLWSNLLNLNDFKELNTIGVHVNERKHLVRVIYDELIESFLKIMKKLDLNAVKIEHGDETENEQQQQQQQQLNTSIDISVSSNPIAGLRPSRPKDLEILINLVDFSRELLIQKHYDLFERWLFRFSKEIILLSSKYFLLSGFYKLNTLCMRIAIRLEYFKRINDELKNNKSFNESIEEEEEENTNEETMNKTNLNNLSTFEKEIDLNLQYDKLNCFFLYKKFIKEIYVRMKQFKDELLASCLEFMLSLPKELIVLNLKEVFEALQASLEIGINYLPMADNALTSLEYWLHNIPLARLKPFYPAILAKFDDYLQMRNLNSSTDELATQEKVLLLKVNAKNSGKKGLMPKGSKGSSFEKGNSSSYGEQIGSVVFVVDELYEQIQLRILKILGQLAGDMSHCLYDENDVNASKQLIAWDTNLHLKFYVPFTDMKPVIYFDRFLPRVIYLALSSTNRQTKIIACELLHAIVIYTIGKSVSDPESGGAQFRLTKIYHIIYPALFKLACDVDHFARNLFQPLVMQMIHWFTGNKKYESADTIELLNCIMDCLVDEKDAALRDFSSSTLREFLKWSIKHTPVAKQDAVSQNQQSPVNVKSILKRIFNFLTHPSSSKRLGALRAWNSIYTIFREEEILVNKFIFELLYHLVQSLALAEKDDKMLGTQEQCKLALDHVERIIRVKAEILNERSADRVKPLGWAEAVLEVAIRWLMRQCGRIETECRHKSMELVHKLTPCINGVKDTREYFQLKLKHDGVGYFIGRFEGSVQKNLLFRDSLANFKTLPELGSGDGDDSTYQLSFVLTWLGMLVAPLDCYTWIFGERLMQPSVLFGDAATPNAPNPQKTCIWTSLSYFFDNVVNLDLTDLIKRVYAKNNDKALVVCTPHEIEEYKRTKCTALVRTFDFLITLLSWQANESMRLIPSHMWSEQLFTCLIRTCLDPARMGFSLSDLDVLTNLPIKSRQVLKLLSQNLHPNVVARLKQLCVVLIDERREFKSLHDYIELIKIRSGDNDDGDDVMMNQSEMIGQIDWLKLSQLVNGYEQLSELDLYHFPDNLNRVLFEYILNKEEVDDQQESQTCAEAKRKLLNLTLSLNSFSTKSSQSSDFLIQIVDKYLFSSTNETEKTSKTPKTNMNRFLQYYKNEIFQWMCKRHESLLTYVLSKLNLEFVKSVSLLTHLIEYVGTEKVLRKTCGTKLVAYLYDHWHAFKEFWQNATAENGVDRKLALINLLTKSLLIESFQSQSANKEQSFKNIAEMYMSFLVDKQLKLAQKIKLLDLLFFFTESPAPYTLKLYLPQLVAQLPLKSSELVRGEPAFNDYTSSIRKILVALEFTGSLDILSLVVSIICREKQHLLESEVQLTFVKLMHRSSLEKQASLITSYWEQAFKNAASAAQDEERRLALFNKLVYEFLKSCAKPVFIDFMCANAIYLFELLDVPFRDVNFENTCSNRTCALRIFELAYKRLHKDEIFCPTAKLCNTYETKKIGQVKDGKELTKEVLRKCRKNLIEEYKFTSTNIPLSRLDSCDELLRQLHCSAYNCLTSLFIRTQREPKLYLACLFKEDAAQGEFIFEPLIDKKREYTFPIEMTDTSSYTQRKTKLISLRDEFRRDEADQTSSTQANYISTIHSTNSLAATYLNTQNLYESSLSEELGVFDFMNAGSNSFRPSLTSSGSFTSGNSSLSEQQQQLELKRKYANYFRNRRLSGGGSNSDLTSMNSAGGASDLESTPIELELDDLNQHECMVAFVELLQSLVVNKITPVYDRGQTPSDMPPWMSYLHRKCVDVVYTHDNVKLFILRAILNTPHIFKPYAKFWLAPMIGFLVNCSSLTKLDYIDAFTLDLMVLMLSWHSVAVPQASEKKIVNRLFESLIRRCYHETRAILKNNLELLKTMTELWRELIEVPVGMIYDYLSAPSTDQRKLITGIQLFGIVLTNQIDVYDYPTNVSSLDFYRALISCMRNTSKSMHAPSAEVVGLLLRWLQKKQKLLDNSEAAKKAEQEKFDRVLEDLFQVLSRLELNLFITCVHRIQLNYPPISERCMTKLIHNLPKLYGEYKLMCAESILSSIHTLQDPFFKLNAFMNMLTHRESALQLVCLKMLNAVIDKQPEEEIARMLPIVCSFVNHSNIACRYQMLVALISIYDIYAGAAQSTTTANIKRQTQETLLRALLDPEPTIRVIAHNFWTEKANMPSSTIDRMCMILDKMYSPQIESEYLSYATNLLLEKTSKSPDYNRLIFESPLSECAFREYNLSADWKVRHEIMTPLFVDTLSSLNAATSSLDPNGSNISSNFLRATQQNSLAQFQPTQDALAMSNARNKPVVTNAYNWLTQSSMDTLQASLISGFSLGETQSSLLFSAAPSSASRKSSSIANPNEAQDTDPDRDIYRLKKRFLKDISPNVQSRFFSRKNMEKKDKEEEARKQMRMNKMSRVEKYRKYRIGDFPDIQIKFSEIIAPVQALAQKDSQVAMVLFESLFVSILSEVSDLKDTNEARNILKSIESNFNHIFTTSDSYNPNLIACAVEIALKHATSFRLEASSISMACMNSLQQSFGVVLIEEYLALDANQKHQKISSKSDDEEDAPVRKRIRLSDENVEEKRGSHDDEDETRILWIELAKLYRSMNDYDSIKGIFANKKNIVTDFTKNGFEFESNNDYQQARKCYSEAMGTFSSNNNSKKSESPDQESQSTTINPTRTEKDLWEESYLRCCNELTDWKSMCEYSTRSSTVSLRQLFSDFSSPDSVLFPYAFKSKLKIILQEDIAEQRRHEDLIKFMAELDSDSKKSLEQSFALEMAIINLHQKDLSAAKYYANMAIERFLVEWASINKTILQSRITKLQSLQAVIELNEFLKFVEINPTFSVETTNHRVNGLVELWTSSMPNLYSDPPATWDDVITNRCIYLEYIEDKYYSNLMNEDFETSSIYFANREENDMSRQKVLNKIKKSRNWMRIKFAEAAHLQGNYKLALTKLQQTRQVLKAHNLIDLRFTWINCYLNTHLSRSKRANAPDERLNTFFNTNVLKEILKYDDAASELEPRSELYQDHCILHANFARFLIDSLFNATRSSPNYYDEKIVADSKKSSQLIEYVKADDISDFDETVDKLMKHGLKNLLDTKHELKGSLELSSYCDYFLRLIENDEPSMEESSPEKSTSSESTSSPCEKIKIDKIAPTIRSEFPSIVIEQLLNAIRLNSYEARQRFPRLLQILSLYNGNRSDVSLVELFVEHSRSIPCWMFLGWLSQMLPLLLGDDDESARALKHIVEAMCAEYPRGVVYALKMSLEQRETTATADVDEKRTKSRTGENFARWVRAWLANKMQLESQFVAALDQLATTPQILFKDYISEMVMNFKNREKFLSICRQFYVDLIELNGNGGASSNQPQQQVEHGKIRREFAQFLLPMFNQAFGNNGQLLATISESEFREKLNQMNKRIQQDCHIRDGNLVDHSPWLSNFKRNLAKDLEIPGQYTGKTKPMPEYHVKIESFDERVQVMHSLRRPKRLIIRGNDQKEHSFLVKGGEDQRQDERIETLFELINELLKSDPKCYARNLNIRTYQVIPMTSKLALIEWMPDTVTFKSIFEQDGNVEAVTKASQLYLDYINAVVDKNSENVPITHRHIICYSKYGRDLVVSEFERIQSHVPWDAMRRFVRSLSSSAQAYFVLRNRFVTSYAVASTCQYILGMGDRHLGNWMFDMNSGRAIGIDFGMAFGLAQINIAVPELMPIRLTRQILKLMAPLEHSGLFEASMVHILEALRENNDLLMCVLDVFIKEPSIDWIGNASRIGNKAVTAAAAASNNNNANSSELVKKEFSFMDYAKSRVNSVKQKLYGINPSVIMNSDLTMGHKDKPNVLKNLYSVSLGIDPATKFVSQRAKLYKEKGKMYRLTVEEQVACIIEQSTDLNILGRTWCGWQPFV